MAIRWCFNLSAVLAVDVPSMFGIQDRLWNSIESVLTILFFSILQLKRQRYQLALLMDRVPEKDVLKCFIMEHGALFVTELGAQRRQQ